MDVLHETAVLHAAEQQLAGTQAALLLTIVEVHLEAYNAAAGGPIRPSRCAFLSMQGPKLGSMHDSAWEAVLGLLPDAASYTANLEDSRPHAAEKRSIFSALLKVLVESGRIRLLENVSFRGMTGVAVQVTQGAAMNLVQRF